MASVSPVSSHVRERDLVKEIAKAHGHVEERWWARLDKDTRHEFEVAWLARDRMIGSTVIALAKEIYTMDVRFIFELLQNADDNLFQRATSSGESPYVLFSVYQDRIVVDCNEDGFTEANLRAICTVGESSKLGGEGYIGEKGIGFKSVFKVAWKVSIQSGGFSFRFKHRPGDSGMGMISPEWWEPTEELVGPLTRITLYLHDTGGDADARAEQRKNINEQFSDLKPEMLLFLKRLKKIEVRFFDGAGNQTSASLLSANPGEAVHQALLETTKVTGGGETTCVKQNYHVTKRTAFDLARKDNRDYSAEEQATQAYAIAEIVLAFPLSKLHVPIIKQQKLFAFLPIRVVGFNFLIHSDFATTASREDIVTSSRRNKGLRQYLASTFVIAIQQMCQHPQLRFQWMRYLPSLSGSLSDDPFWKVFIDMLKADIINAEIMIPRTGVRLRPIKRLRMIAEDFKDEQGEPLFDDLLGQDAIYHSNMYMSGDLNTLQGYGLKVIDIQDVLQRLEADLRSPTSKWKSAKTNSDWHSRIAKLLLKFSSAQHSLKRLAILPLTNGRWMSTNGGDAVYLPTTVEGHPVPDALGLNLVDPAAAMHTDRRQLYLELGVIQASSEDIRSRVLGFYQKDYCRDLPASLRMIQFLYLTQPTNEQTAKYDRIDIISSDAENILPHSVDTYFMDVDAEYGPAKLGLDVCFADPAYLSNPPVQPDGKTVDQVAWRNWLHDVIGIRRRLRLVSPANPDSGPSETSLSGEVLCVAEDSPPLFIGLLKSLWPHEGSKVTGNSDLLGELREVEVLCEGGKMVPLSETILPLAGLKQVCSRFLEDGEDLPFLKLVPAILPTSRGWSFVDSLGVITQDGLHFYLAMIKAIAAACSLNNTTRPERIMRLYAGIYASCIASVSREEREQGEKARDTVRATFARFNTVFISAPRTGPPRNVEWYPLGGPYLLNAPPGMRHKHPIDSLYRDTFPDDESKLQTVILFFTDTLGIPECSWRDFVEELRYLKGQKCTEMEYIQDQFRFLEEQTAEADLKLLSVLLGEEALVYAPGGLFAPVWHTTRNCIWSTATSVKGKVNLAKHYDSALENFFVHVLGVQKLNVNMIYDELLGLTPMETVDVAKQQLWSLNSLLRTETLSGNRAPHALLRKAILPVRYGDRQVTLRSSSVEFAIIDNRTLEEKFRRHVNTLDFDMRQVRTLQPFLEWSGLEDRYLSRMVKETPNLSSGVKVPVSDKRFDINRKAYALVRVACHFHSPRFRDDGAELYDILQHSETWETDGISSDLSLTIDGQTVTARVEQGDVYIDDSPESRLKIYIPHDEETQDVCIQHTLPEKLVAWLMTTAGAEPPMFVDKAAVGVIKGVLNARFASVARILEKEGIVEIDLPAPKLDDGHIQALALVSAPMVPRTPGRSPSAVSVVSTEISHLGASSNSHVSRSEAETSFTGPLPVGTPGSRSSRAFAAGEYFQGEQTSPLPRVFNIDLYRELLGHVIRASRNRELLGQGATGLYNMSGLRTALTGEAVSAPTPRQYSSAGFSTHEVGAAGELFVFELLSRLSPRLPGFSHSNWTSTIKWRVKAHPDYESTEPWVGHDEEADLQYEDTAGVFTRLLTSKGYLPSEWLAKKPKYYFEVKSTPSTCKEPFSMSGVQYNKRFTTADSVYIIFRVFNLYSDDIDVKLYVDPLELKKQGQLQFARNFTVTARY